MSSAPADEDKVVREARPGRGTTRPVPAAVDLRRLVDSAADLVMPLACQKGLNVAIHCERDVPQLILIDGRLLEQILLNLLDNAVKFTSEGFVAIRVQMRPADDGTLGVELLVSDTGPGIPAEERGTLIPLARSRARPGGLAVCDRLARSMNGTVEIDGRPGTGSTFRLWLPAPPAAAAESDPAKGGGPA
jgi:signal transduction histidine kinase